MNSTKTKNLTMRLLNKQRAQFILFDAAYPMNPTILKSAITSLLNVLALGATMRGYPRLPVFGMSILNQSIHHIIKLGPLKGNYPAISKALSELNQEVDAYDQLSESEFFDNLHLALKTTLEEFNPSKYSSTGTELELSISILTRRDGYQIKLNLLPFLDQFKAMRKLHTLQIIELTDTDEWEDFNNPQLQYYQVSINNGGFEACLKRWLTLPSCESEHLRVIIASTVLRCDMDSCVFDPALVPLAHVCRIDTDPCITPSSMPSTSVAEMVIPKLEIVGRVSNNGVSESLVFGNPILIRPTSFWKLGWPDRQTNKEDFAAFCQVLLAKEEYAVAKLADSMPSGYFLLIPGRCCLLAKSLVSQELQLGGPNILSVRPPVERIDSMRSLVEEIPISDEYTPSPTNLYPQLQRLLSITSNRNEQNDGKNGKEWVTPKKVTAKVAPAKRQTSSKPKKVSKTTTSKTKPANKSQVIDYISLLKYYSPTEEELSSGAP